MIGFDGDPEAEFAAVPITTLEQPVDDLAEIGVRMLLKRLQPAEDVGESEPERIWLEVRLVERASCGPLRDSLNGGEGCDEAVALP